MSALSNHFKLTHLNDTLAVDLYMDTEKPPYESVKTIWLYLTGV